MPGDLDSTQASAGGICCGHGLGKMMLFVLGCEPDEETAQDGTVTSPSDAGKWHWKGYQGVLAMEQRMADGIVKVIETGKLSLKEIADCSDLSLEEVQKLADEELQPV